MKLNNSDKVMQDSALKLASAAYVKEEGERLLKEANELNQMEKEELSKQEIEEFEKFCKKEFKKNEWKRSNVLKIVATVAVLAIVINIGIKNNTNTETNDIANYQGDVVNKENMKYIPEYIPKDYKKYTVNKIQQNYDICYENEKSEVINFSYEKVTDKALIKYESYKSDEITYIGGRIGNLQKKDRFILTWIADNHLFTIKAQGITEEELIKIAESVKEN